MLLPLVVATEESTPQEGVKIGIIETPEQLRKCILNMLKDKDLSKRGPFTELVQQVKESIQ